MEHDPSASQATFVEISFGVNILWAVFDRVSSILKTGMDAKMDNRLAKIKVLESKKAQNSTGANRLYKLKNQTEELGMRHLSVQDMALNIVKIVSTITAILCAVIVFFDFQYRLGGWVALLMSPLPIYVISSFAIYFLFRRKINKMFSDYEQFINTYEGDIEEMRNKIENI